eukprot:m.31024 g.31024  ORF g.31024 m.31024 type:complete len:112 (-) comp6272_c0_seq1:217-552(-)
MEPLQSPSPSPTILSKATIGIGLLMIVGFVAIFVRNCFKKRKTDAMFKPYFELLDGMSDDDSDEELNQEFGETLVKNQAFAISDSSDEENDGNEAEGKYIIEEQEEEDVDV